MLFWIIGAAILGSLGAIAGAALFLFFPESIRKILVPCLISYATGTLLAAAFLGMIPTGLAQASAKQFMAILLTAIIMFFILEKLVIWRHCHDDECKVHNVAAPLILIGDAFHNFVDGVVIATAFLSSMPLGVATAFAVIMHEVPQEVSDFAILLNNNYSLKKALILNTLSSLSALLGALIAYVWIGEAHQAIPYILAISAASFIYIAIADLIPMLHKQVTPTASLQQVLLLLVGIATIVVFN